MSHEIEIEFKNMLTKEEFNRLKKGLALKETDFVTQHNDYFDTTEASLKERQSALRIREKAGRFVLTLKQPHDTGLLETHQPLSIDQVNAFFSTNTLPVGDVVAQLLKMSIPVNSLIHLGRLTTSRAEWQQLGGLVVLDHSFYFDQEDYELEFEASDYESGKTAFARFLSDWKLPVRQTQNKLYRFYTYKTSNHL